MRRIAMFTAILAVSACGKKDDSSSGTTGSGEAKPAGGGGAAKPAAPAAMTWKKLDKLGLQIEVPGDTEVMDTSVDAPGASIFDNDFKVSVDQTTPVYTDDFDAAKAEHEKDPGCTFKAWTKSEKTPDGWDFEWTCTGMASSELKYKVEIRRTFGDKKVHCQEMLDSQEKAAATIKACGSLKPL